MASAACTTPRGLQPERHTDSSLSDMATALPAHQNAPPAPFNGTLTGFANVDNTLTALPGWRYLVQLDFEGVFADTPRQATLARGSLVQPTGVGAADRHQTSGELIGQEEDTSVKPCASETRRLPRAERSLHPRHPRRRDRRRFARQ
ncbi:MAG: hypothetical protein U0521_13110 [Anaerolineae bacterium]